MIFRLATLALAFLLLAGLPAEPDDHGNCKYNCDKDGCTRRCALSPKDKHTGHWCVWHRM